MLASISVKQGQGSDSKSEIGEVGENIEDEMLLMSMGVLKELSLVSSLYVFFASVTGRNRRVFV